MKIGIPGALSTCLFLVLHSASAFEGRITATLTRGGDEQQLLYTAATNFLRVERLETDRPHARDIFDLQSGAITLLFPHNRSFVRLKADSENVSANRRPGMPAMPNPPGVLPPGVGPQAQPPVPPGSPATIGPANLPGMPTPPPRPQMPPMPAGAGMPPAMPMMAMPEEKSELTATGEKTNILGYACARYEFKQRGQTMEIWATSELFTFQPYQENQGRRFGPRMIEDQWGELLKAKKLFPLAATLKFDNGPERLRFEVKTITPEKIKDDNGQLFQPPSDYRETEPLSFRNL